MAMEFRARDYGAERGAYALPRTRADSDPLSAPAACHPQVDLIEDKREEFVDPLREANTNVAVALDNEEAAAYPSTATASEVSEQEDAVREWIYFKRFLMQRFPASRILTISAVSDGILRSGKGYEKLSAPSNLDDLDDSQKLYEDGSKTISRQEYTSRLKEFKVKIIQAWQSDDRVTSLKLAIKVAKLLTDTSVGQFYPTLFVLATDIIDMLGDLVWDRIKQKAECAGDGTFLCSLPVSFQACDASLDARETCKNWFSKIGSVKELLIRIYLESALLPCWRFLVDKPNDIIQRLVMMTRGLADPLACSYSRLYIARCAQKLPSADTGYLIRCINDTTHLLMHSISPMEGNQKSSKDSKKSLVNLMEPSIEYIMRHIFKGASQKLVESTLDEFGIGDSEPYGTPSISIIVHHLLKELPADIVNSKAMYIVNLIEFCEDYTLDQCLNYRLLGFRLSESNITMHMVSVVDQVLKVVSQKEMLDDYLKVVDAFVDLILQKHMDDQLLEILDGILRRACHKGIIEDELVYMQSILVKLISHFDNLEDIFTLNHFLEILDMMYGWSLMTVNMHILEKATRRGLISDSTIIQFLFEVSQALFDSLDEVNMRDDDPQQPTHLISRFISKVNYGAEIARHLAFLVECRRAFGSTNELKETLIHSSNFLAIKALRDENNHLDFLKSCIAFSEVTVSSITASEKQLKLYLETAEVALLGGLVSHSEGLIDSAISCMQSLDLADGSRGPTDAEETLSSLQKICGLLVTVPGNPAKGVIYTLKNLFAILNSQSWMTPRMRVRMCCAMISLSAAMSQKTLPYHTDNSAIPGNDMLFYGDATYSAELATFSSEVVHKLLEAINQEPSPVARGSMAVEACNCIAMSFKMSIEISTICFDLLEMARKGLSTRDRYLKSTINLVDSYSASPQTCQ